ncbi:MAG: ParB-like protein, partial [Cyanobacteriota bacterium]|nr:ParB-like protein [Cyanobacteriota bacterium]
ANYNVTLEPSESDSIVGDVIPLTLDQVRGGQPALGKDQIRYKLGRFNGVNWPEGVDEEINGLLQPGRFFSDDQKMFEDVAEANGRSTDDVVRSDNSTPKDPNSFEARDPVGTNTGDMKTVVLGPDGGYYLTDGHHTSNVFVGLDRGGLEDFTLNFVVQDDFSDLTDENGNGSAMDEFWVEMANNGYGWLKILNEDENRYDYMPGVTGVDDEYRVTAVDLDVFEMPAEMGIDNFANDPYRSIAYFTREIGWNKPSDTPAEGLPFVEFYWAEEIQDAIQAGNTDLDLSQYDLTDLSSYLEVIEITAEWMVSLDANELIGTSSFTAQEMGQLESFNPDGVLETLVDASEPDESGEATKFLKVEDSDEADAADIGDLPRPGKLAYAWADQFGDLPVIEGTDDDDEIVGSESDVRIFAKAGNDTVAGGLGNDEIYGEADNDILRGDLNTSDPQGNIEGGNDTIFGGSGDDNIGGKAGSDQLYGDDGNDEIWGDDGDDLLRGGLGDDLLTGDDFSGGSGADTFILAVGEGTDTITDFEVGIDVIGLEGLTFADLSLSGNVIAVADEILAIVEGVTELMESDFVSLG